MNKINSGPRRVFVSSDFRKADYVPLSDEDWLTLQTKLKRPTTRKRLNAITKKYASFARPENAQLSVKNVQRELNDWRTRTQRLRNILWSSQRTRPKSSKGSSGGNAKKILSDFYTVLDRQFSGDISAQEFIYPLALLDRFLSGAIAVSKCAEQSITSRHVANNPETELWFLWATMVMATLKMAGIPVKAPNRNQLMPGPIDVLVKLQATLPSEFHRRKGASLRKAAVHAYKISRGNPIGFMNSLFGHWGKGDISFGRRDSPTTSTLGTVSFLARFDDQVTLATKAKSARILDD